MKEVKIYPNAKNQRVRWYAVDRPLLTMTEDGVEVRQATEAGYVMCKRGGVIDVSYPGSRLRRGRVQGDGGDICPAVTCGVEGSLVVFEGYERKEE